MLLAEKATGHLVEVLDVTALVDPLEATVRASLHYGEEAQDPERFDKTLLAFPSGEPLPRCWTDPDYRRRSPARSGQ
ncbi:MAG: acetyltransferase [Marinobacter sp.]|nr:acetyltransferase [Marinobacter sp.]